MALIRLSCACKQVFPAGCLKTCILLHTNCANVHKSIGQQRCLWGSTGIILSCIVFSLAYFYYLLHFISPSFWREELVWPKGLVMVVRRHKLRAHYILADPPCVHLEGLTCASMSKVVTMRRADAAARALIGPQT